MNFKKSCILFLSLILVFCSNNSITTPVSWDKISEISLPNNYSRTETSAYGKWIRNIKLNKDNTVYYFNGNKKRNQNIHIAVLNFDVGDRDLQQCADACMRIRAEYLFEVKQYDKIKFLFANGKWVNFATYTTKRDYKSFRSFMNYVYAFANTASLKKQLKHIPNNKDVQVGDVFIQSGNPYGHAITVMDVCVNEKGQKMMMLSQSYMPAQSIEVLKNEQTNLAWFPVNFGEKLITPEWTFYHEDLYRF